MPAVREVVSPDDRARALALPAAALPQGAAVNPVWGVYTARCRRERRRRLEARLWAAAFCALLGLSALVLWLAT